MGRRVVVTGMGAVTPVGHSVAETWRAVCAGKSGVAPITLFDAADFSVKIAAEVKGFVPEDCGIDRKQARKMARFSQFLLAAAHEAVSDAGYSPDGFYGENAGIVTGVGIGGFDAIEAGFKKYDVSGVERLPPLTAPLMLQNEPAANVSMRYGITGPVWTVSNACAAGTDAAGVAFDLIRSGRVDVCLAGGTEATITGFGIGMFQALQALSTRFNDAPEKASRPFDTKRDGFVMGEGGAVLVMEALEHALSRGAHIYAEVAGYGASGDAYHITAPREDGTTGALAITRALRDAGLAPTAVQYYNAHGTSTHANDPAETKMIKQAFGNHAYSLKISSTKSMTGHLIGAAGTIEAIICVKAICDGFVPPTINLDEPDVAAGCDLDYVPNVGQSVAVQVAASSSFGFGGHNGCLIIKR
ncbi:MAG: beta-ketoacyl-ACP synthase II, partial [Treponema sp.]|nr:beta-ketoacyl-ACP synthase II [Treponema sp.]